MKSIPAKYFDGLKPESIYVEVIVNGAVLDIFKDGIHLGQWPLSKMYRDQNHLVTAVFGCQDLGDERLELLEAADLQELQKVIPALANAPHKYSQRKMLIYLFSVILFCVGIVLSVKPLTKFAARHVSIETEQKIASQLNSFSYVKKCNLNFERSFALEKLLSKIYPQSAEDKKLGIQVQIVKNSQSNAFALPGGEIWLLSGLLNRAESPEEIAGILAHEIEHIKQRHIIERLIRSTLVTSLMSIAAGDVSGVLAIDPQTMAGLLALSYDRDQEAQADEGARLRLIKAGISTKGMIQFFERNANSANSNIPKFLTTHPVDQDRIKSLQKDSLKESKIKILEYQEWVSLRAPCY